MTRPAPPRGPSVALSMARSAAPHPASWAAVTAFSADGRCITLLKVLLSNDCMYDCKYCVNRRTNETRRATFTPEELADLTIQFYRRNYIEGLFLLRRAALAGLHDGADDPRAVHSAPRIPLQRLHPRQGHPGASPELVEQLGMLADRLSVNIELPSEASLRALAPNKTKAAVLRPMRFIADRGQENRRELVKYRHAPRFAPAGQATQMIVGATGESDRHILTLTQSLYDTYHLKRVFYSAYVPVVENTLLPSLDTKPPLLREHRLYQADWLLRFYGFRAGELLDEASRTSTRCSIPSVAGRCGTPTSSRSRSTARITKRCCAFPASAWSARSASLSRAAAGAARRGPQKLGVVLKRAQYFLTCSGRSTAPLRLSLEGVRRNLTATGVPRSRRDRSTSLSSLSRHNEELFMTWREVVYEYDGSFDGLLCCIYESYTQKELPAAFFRTGESSHACMRSVTSRRTRARTPRIRRLPALSPEVGPFCAAHTGHACPKRSFAIYHFAAKLYREGKLLLQRLSDETYHPFAARCAAAEWRAGAIPRLRALFRHRRRARRGDRAEKPCSAASARSLLPALPR